MTEVLKSLKIKPQWIKKLEVIGKSLDGADIYHLITKGGLHQILKKHKNKKDYIVLGYGPHRATARFMANQMEKNIQWVETLFKSDSSSKEAIVAESFPQQPVQSTIDSHIAQATYHIHQAQSASDVWDRIHHKLRALAHFNAAGLEQKKILEQYNELFRKLNKNLIMDPPYDEKQLIEAYEAKHNKSFKAAAYNFLKLIKIV